MGAGRNQKCRFRILRNAKQGLLTPVYSTSGLVTGEGIAAKPRLWTRADLRNKTRNILTLKQLFATANDECHFENLKRQIPKSKSDSIFSKCSPPALQSEANLRLNRPPTRMPAWKWNTPMIRQVGASSRRIIKSKCVCWQKFFPLSPLSPTHFPCFQSP